jgi:metal-dependent amidase/aminoacylase/carboxypeptidase family protein
MPVTFNNEKLTHQIVSSLKRAAGENNVTEIPPDTGSEDFAYYLEKVPGMFFFVGACPPEMDPAKAPSHHTPDFMMDERSMLTGLKAMLQITVDYMYAPKK